MENKLVSLVEESKPIVNEDGSLDLGILVEKWHSAIVITTDTVLCWMCSLTTSHIAFHKTQAI